MIPSLHPLHSAPGDLRRYPPSSRGRSCSARGTCLCSLRWCQEASRSTARQSRQEAPANSQKVNLGGAEGKRAILPKLPGGALCSEKGCLTEMCITFSTQLASVHRFGKHLNQDLETLVITSFRTQLNHSLPVQPGRFLSLVLSRMM